MLYCEAEWMANCICVELWLRGKIDAILCLFDMIEWNNRLWSLLSTHIEQWCLRTKDQWTNKKQLDWSEFCWFIRNFTRLVCVHWCVLHCLLVVGKYKWWRVDENWSRDAFSSRFAWPQNSPCCCTRYTTHAVCAHCTLHTVYRRGRHYTLFAERMRTVASFVHTLVCNRCVAKPVAASVRDCEPVIVATKFTQTLSVSEFAFADGLCGDVRQLHSHRPQVMCFLLCHLMVSMEP